MTASSETRARRVVLPEVETLSMRDARVVLANAGLSRVKVHYTESYGRELDVIEQSPPGGRLVDANQEVLLYVSRRNLMGYLPQVYQQLPEESIGFLRGLLYVVQQVFDDVTDRLDTIHQLFDPRVTEPEFLPWLGTWLAITLNPEWDDLHRRKMLRAATRLFPYRGTARAIEEFVRIYTGADVTVEENKWPHSGFKIGVSSSVGVDSVLLPTMNLAHCFVVRLDLPAEDVSDDEVTRIHEILQAQKPAQTAYYLAFSEDDTWHEERVYLRVGEERLGAVVDATGPEEGGDGDDAVSGEDLAVREEAGEVAALAVPPSKEQASSGTGGDKTRVRRKKRSSGTPDESGDGGLDPSRRKGRKKN